jgi:acetyl-CoA synthetase (ADP-forming)/acetyltransferase
LGVIQVYSIDEMLDLLVAFTQMRIPKGRRVGILGVGGGASVQATDECESHGLIVPRFPMELRDKLTKSTPQVGTSLSNPVDTSIGTFWNTEALFESIKTISYSNEVDLLLIYLNVVYAGFRLYKETNQSTLEVIVKANQWLWHCFQRRKSSAMNSGWKR